MTIREAPGWAGRLTLLSWTALLIHGCNDASDEPPASEGTSPPPVLEESLAQVRGKLGALGERGIGISVAVVTGEGVLWSEAYGYADVERGRPATPGTRFRIYSLAKPMTAVAAARLMEGGRLDPTSPVQAYVPTFPEKASPITPMHLATHTSSIRHYADEEESRSRQHCQRVEDALTIFSEDPLFHTPGARETYSSWGYGDTCCSAQCSKGRRAAPSPRPCSSSCSSP